MTRGELNELGSLILDACLKVHTILGPGLLESVYTHALLTEFGLRGIKARHNVPVPLFYKTIDTGKCFEIDILVENEIIIEAKSVEIMHPVFDAQIISYLKLADKRLGYLVNFKGYR